ncbi:MAG: Modular polyketide synthase, partial [uncultured Corynebacteriales bacterium]
VGHRGQAPPVPQAGHRRARADPATPARAGGPAAGAGRRGRHGVPPARRDRLAGGPVGAARGRRRRHRAVPRRPRLGPGWPPPPRPRPPGHQLRPYRRVPPRRRQVRRRLLRRQPAGGPGQRPAAAAAAGAGLGAARTRRHRPHVPARQPHRRLRRGVQPRLRLAVAHPRGDRGVRDHRQPGQRGLRADRVHARAGGSGRHRRHGLLRLAGRHPPGRPGPAGRGVPPGAGRRRHRPGHADGVHRVLPAAGSGPGRPVQVVRGGGRRDRVLRGRRAGAAGAAVRRPPQRSPGARGRPRVGGQLRRRVERPDRAERRRPGAGHPAGPGRRPGGRRHRRRRRGPRHRHHARRPDRGQRPAGDVRTGPAGRPAALARLGQVQYRPHAGRRGRGRRDQDGAGPPAPAAAGLAAHRRGHPARRLVARDRTAAARAGRLARRRPPAPGRGVLVRDLRHQRPPDPGAGPGPGRGPARRARRRPPPALGGLGRHRARPARAGRGADPAGHRRPGGVRDPARLVPADHPSRARPSGGRARPRP